MMSKDILKVPSGDYSCPGSPLRQISQPVSGSDVDLLTLLEALRESLKPIAYGAGLSAIQLGVPFRVAIVNITKKPGGEIILIDPVIVSTSGRMTSRLEGCLSLPNFKGRVKRRENIVIKSFNLDGDQVTLQASGYEAAVIQHELDHMDGVFYWDRMAGGQYPEPILTANDL